MSSQRRPSAVSSSSELGEFTADAVIALCDMCAENIKQIDCSNNALQFANDICWDVWVNGSIAFI